MPARKTATPKKAPAKKAKAKIGGTPTSKKTVGRNGNGGQTRYTHALAKEILMALSMGKSLLEVCRGDGMPSAVAVHSWVVDDVHGFAARYKDARRIGYLIMADAVLDMADDGSNDWMESNNPNNPGWVVNGEAIARSRLRVDTRKWMLPKVLPDEFGDKTAIDLRISDETKSDAELLEELQTLRAITGVAPGGKGRASNTKRLN